MCSFFALERCDVYSTASQQYTTVVKRLKMMYLKCLLSSLVLAFCNPVCKIPQNQHVTTGAATQRIKIATIHSTHVAFMAKVNSKHFPQKTSPIQSKQRQSMHPSIHYPYPFSPKDNSTQFKLFFVIMFIQFIPVHSSRVQIHISHAEKPKDCIKSLLWCNPLS